jgi:hypothetical protein
MEQYVSETGVEREVTPPAVKRATWVGRSLDDAVKIPGTDFRIGLDPILGILPGAGDAVAALLSLYIIVEAIRAGVPRSTVLRMLAYIGVDAVVGSVPVLGTVFDAFWKANMWNAKLLARHYRERSAR